ncbi:hypothetical protein L3081_22780 [Colwellia sp. MSW7]|uniref:DUF3570 domain-containing protein n=1 Tax=Colwellia maritima TaxID=2912588 RepID=A0ABS9X869_9GAMM|nr:hypothetical protein [Colwellia maritima]MCI2285686.1 hypothetical protein [Colwellia maritima]
MSLMRAVFILAILFMPDAIAQEKSDTPIELIVVYPKPEDDWLFGFHDAISDSVYGTAQWFDSFFASDEIDGTKTESSLRVRVGEPRARDLDVFTQKFRLRLKLPNLEQKIDFIFSDELDDNQGNNDYKGQNLTSKGGDTFTAAIRLINSNKANRFIDSRIGISSGDLFAKVRLKYLTEFAENHLFEFQPSIYYYLKDGLGKGIFSEYNYNYSKNKQFRTNISVRFSQAFEGYKWKHESYFLRQIDRRQASAIGFVIQGENNAKRGFVADNYKLSYLYRANAYRKWLFFEVEPFLEWPEEDSYSTTPGIALRVEGYFNQN